MIGEDDYDFVVVLVVRLHVQDGLAAAVAVVPVINAVCRCSAITVDPSFCWALSKRKCPRVNGSYRQFLTIP